MIITPTEMLAGVLAGLAIAIFVCVVIVVVCVRNAIDESEEDL